MNLLYKLKFGSFKINSTLPEFFNNKGLPYKKTALHSFGCVFG